MTEVSEEQFSSDLFFSRPPRQLSFRIFPRVPHKFSAFLLEPWARGYLTLLDSSIPNSHRCSVATISHGLVWIGLRTASWLAFHPCSPLVCQVLIFSFHIPWHLLSLSWVESPHWIPKEGSCQYATSYYPLIHYKLPLPDIDSFLCFLFVCLKNSFYSEQF